MSHLSLRTKLAIMVALNMALVAIFLLLFFPGRMDNITRRWAERRADGVGHVLASALEEQLARADTVGARALLTTLETGGNAMCASLYGVDGARLGGWHSELCTSGRSEEDALFGEYVVGTDDEPLGRLVLGFNLSELNDDRSSNLLTVALVSAILFLLGLAFSLAAGTILVAPIQRMTVVADRIANGDLSHINLELEGNDEVGNMAKAFNRMLASLRRLSVAADQVSAGNLAERLELSGQVAESFNRMMDSQRDIIRDIATVSTQLASASAEIYAASQEQEAAAARQSAGVEEVSRTMQSLLESAAHISESARGVLGNAERTRETNDVTARKIEELSGHTARIAEILEVIREIADRSDLLALNASLEGTRAGEAGRSFSLVATEMRRLAERVTASVEDVKTLLADVRASGSSTIMATEEARKLAENTTESARQISMVTQQQRTGTAQASESMKDLSDLLIQSVSAAQETRSLAEALKQTADRLSDIVGRFRIDSEVGV